MQSVEIDRLLASDENALYVTLGHALGSRSLGVDAADERRLVQRAKAWLAQSSGNWQAAICSDPSVRDLAQGGVTCELVAAVCTILESAALGTAATPLAVLLCKQGLAAYCRTHWSAH